VDRAHRRPRGEGAHGDPRFPASRQALASHRPANDNRIGFKGWLGRLAALVLLIGLAALLAWKVAG
jgi:hypothetical protein